MDHLLIANCMGESISVEMGDGIAQAVVGIVSLQVDHGDTRQDKQPDLIADVRCGFVDGESSVAL